MAIDYTAEFDESEFGDDAANEAYWREQLKNQPVLKNPAPRSPWNRFMDSISDTVRHYSPVAAGARAVQRSIPIDRDYNKATGGETQAQRKKRLVQEERDWREVRSQRDPADSVGDYVVDFAGGLVGGMVSDPTNLIAPGGSLGKQVLSSAAIGVGGDAALQGIEMGEGVRDEYDPVQGAISTAVGPLMVGGIHAGKRANSYRKIHAGSRAPNFNSLLDRVIGLEGGGTLDKPKTSPKGAKGPMQVMDATARDPGFGIRPWNGKTEADRARVGRQYLAALNHKYKGDEAKVLAAYNGGPGRVDNAVRKHGSEWLRAMPKESRDYVRNGTGGDWTRPREIVRFGENDLPEGWNDLPPAKSKEEDLGPIQDALMRQAEDDGGSTFVHNEQPSGWAQEAANDWWEPVDPVPTKLKINAPAHIQAQIDDIKSYSGTNVNYIAKSPDSLVEGELFEINGERIEADSAYTAIDTYNTIKEMEAEGLSVPDEDYGEETVWDGKEYTGDDHEPDQSFYHGENGLKLTYYAPEAGGGGPNYYGVEDYESVTGKKIGPLMKQAIKEYAKENGFTEQTIGSHYFSEKGDSQVKKEVALWRDNLAKEQMTPKEYAAYQKLPSNDPKLHKILSKYLVDPPPPKPTPAFQKRIKAAGETFLRMLKDDSGGAASPERVHEAMTAWDKGTHRLLRGEDGTPLRIYHGTSHPYDGMPSAEQNRMPPGYIVYSTDPEFANNYAHSGAYHNQVADSSRVFPAYVRKGGTIGDFRNPKHLQMAIEWYEKKYGKDLHGGTAKDLAAGHWDKWERPDMMEDLGWKGAYLTEGRDAGVRSVNIVLKPELIKSPFDPATYEDKTIGHKIVRTLRALIKDESGAYHGLDDEVDPDEQFLMDALKRARSVSGETRGLHRKEKAQRGAQLGRIQQEGLGEVGLYAQLKQAKGDMPHADWESIRNEFSQEQIDRLLNKINENKALLPWEKFKASVAMGKLIGMEGANFSKAPNMSEIKLLGQVFSRKLISALLEDRTLMQKLVQGTIKTLSIPRAIMSSMDLSAPFRQGLNYVHKREFWSSFIHMFKLVGSEANSKALMDEIHSRPTWELMKRARLAITDPHSHFMDEHEEGFQGADWAEKIPILGSIGIKASNRAYSGFLNKLRADVFDDYVRQYEAAGINLAADTKKLRQVAAFVNAATGRGNLPKRMEPAAPVLANVFFSPRLISSRLKFIANPMTYLNADPILRKEAWKSAFAMASVALSVGMLAKYGLGMELETDPRSSDFMKPKIGNTRYDIMGGYQQYITLAARFITESEKTSKGDIRDFDKDNPTANTRGKAVLKFARNKLSPVASFVTDWLMGKDTVGRDFSLPQATFDRLHPMAVGDIADAYQEWGAKGVPMASPGILGVGVQTYDPNELEKEKETIEIDPEFSSEFADEFSSGLDYSKEFD